MTPTLVSICIPTYNRGRYVDSLLGTLAQQLDGFPYTFEVLISDNASSDDTPEVVQRHAQALPIRYTRQPHNLGCYPNVQYLMGQAAGRYFVHLSDDDCLLGEPLAQAVAAMEADPEVMVTYAPWILFDLVDQKSLGQFYTVPHDLRVARGEHAELLGHFLRHHVFPEVQLTRTEAMRRIMPRITDLAFFAFVQAADYLAQGAVLIREQPFYVSMTRYFADENRDQTGSQEVEHAWDRYRGGLEYMLARAGRAIGPEERAGLHLRVQEFIAQRIAVAIRIRHHNGRDAIDTHMLAMRLRGMGYEHLCPIPMAELASRATLQFLLRDPVLNRDAERLLCVGDLAPDTAEYLRRHAGKPVDVAHATPAPEALRNALVFVTERAQPPALSAAQRRELNTQVVMEADLCDRFGLEAA